MRLALAFGEPDPDRLARAMPSSLFTQWAALYDFEPWGEERADLRTGILVANVLSALGAKREAGGAFRPVDFMPYAKRERERPARLWSRLVHMLRKRKDGGTGG